MLSVTGYYNKPSQEGLYRHFAAIAEAVDIPIMLYNIPARAIVEISVETMGAAVEDREHHRRQGRHRQSGAAARASARPAARIGVQLSGEDGTALGYMAHGGQGCISVTANVAPRLCAEFQDACLQGRLRLRAGAAGRA